MSFRDSEGKSNFVYRMKEDGTDRRKIMPDPIIHLYGVSPDGQWVAAMAAVSGEETSWAVLAYPSGGGSPVRICDICLVTWGPDGKLLYLWFGGMVGRGLGKTFVIGLPPGKALPALPRAGLRAEADLAGLPVLQVIDRSGISPGPNRLVYAFSQVTAHRNLYRIPVP